ncbi:twin-arginine translocase subunit TatB [Novosphingobium sp. FSY-8]|uniref:Twin-arginine translocase subunit TatB n=1 Tax=Novosphingobium ovatum TaxID=1908523 RepID=A0ABW9XE68_9SPHN|nr:Sec-independent protein translocase protein TatB [Novosphingobium ovatum]NBC36814.1 twin-arginine translocase subunit TatB [Novosphingobium ovatum]
MFLDIAPSEFLLTAVVAVVVIGPKDMPRAMRGVGRWIAKVRRVSGHFRSGIETMIREAEMEDMEKKWREQNEAIMKTHPPAATLAEPAALPAGDAAVAQAMAADPGYAPMPQPEHMAADHVVADAVPAEIAAHAPTAPLAEGEAKPATASPIPGAGPA